MSFNRENVVWLSRNGTWSIGFYGCDVDPDAEDHEWDVQYDFGRFDWASTGHLSEQAACDAWHGANPGGYTSITSAGEETDRLDAMAAEWKAERRNHSSQSVRNYSGWLRS